MVNSKIFIFCTLFILAQANIWQSQAAGQELNDPTAPTQEFDKVLNKIRGVEALNKLQAERDNLAKENQRITKELSEQSQLIESLKTQVAGLKEKDKGLSGRLQKELDVAMVELKELRKTKAVLPALEVKSLSVSDNSAVALLKIGNRTAFVRPNTYRNVLLTDGQYMRVEIGQITTSEVQLRFPELERELVITP
ncbi:MAG: hypothetical protein AAFN77_19225 [Planctomycetota bacterium]